MKKFFNNRWVAASTYLLGIILLIAGFAIQADWSVWLMIAGLAIWSIPVRWAVNKWEKG